MVLRGGWEERIWYTLRKRIVILLVLCLFALTCLSGCSNNSRQELRLGTGNIEGTYYAYGTRLAELLEQNTNNVVEVISTTGSEGNMRLMAAEMIDLAIVQSDTLAAAVELQSELEQETATTDDRNGGSFVNAVGDISAIAGLYTEACQIVVKANSGISTVADLAGRKVSIGEEESGVTRNAEQILMAYGITTDMLEVSRLSFTDSATALERGQIDAFFCTAGAPTQVITSLAETTDIEILPLDFRCRQQITNLYGWYVPYTIPAGTYRGQNDDVPTLGVKSVLIGLNTLSDETVTGILTTLFDNSGTLDSVVAGADLTPEEATEGVSIGFHPAAAAYYAEDGITVDSIEVTDEDEHAFTLRVDMYQTLAIAVGILFLGSWLKKKYTVLEKFCIPSPVVGGLVFAVVLTVLYTTGLVEITFDDTFRGICMVMFFTSVGFQANVKVLKSGGAGLAIFLGLVTGLILLQNVGAMWMSDIIGVDPMIGMCTGSIPMIGGHGTAGAFGPVLEDLGLPSATTLATAAATFGLVAGSLMGGPVGRHLITHNNLLEKKKESDVAPLVEDEKKHHRHVHGYAPAAYQLAIAMGIGTVVSWALSKTGMNFPVYIGAMIVAAVMRNWSEFSGKFRIHMGEINDIGGICLSLFLGIAMITLQLWQLADLALPLIALLMFQVALMYVFANYIVFNAMGRDYDAAVLAAGTCGFGMGATPNAMANMQAITEQFGPSIKAYIIVPIVGSMFADFINSIVITFFINII